MPRPRRPALNAATYPRTYRRSRRARGSDWKWLTPSHPGRQVLRLMEIEPTWPALLRPTDQSLADDDDLACDPRETERVGCAAASYRHRSDPGVRPVCVRKLRTKLATSV